MREVRVSCAPGSPTVAVDIDAVYTDVPRNATTSLRYRLRGKALNARFDAPCSILSAGKRDAEGDDAVDRVICGNSPRSAVHTIDGWVNRRERTTSALVVSTALWNINVTRTSAARTIRRGRHPDGMPLVWLLESAGYRDVGRVYEPDLMLLLFEHPSDGRYRRFFYGWTDHVLSRLPAAREIADHIPRRLHRGHLLTPVSPSRPEQGRRGREHDQCRQAQPSVVGIG